MVVRDDPGEPGCEPALADFRARIEAINLRGLAEAACAWLGDDPDQLTLVLAAWQAPFYGELPRLTSRCWTALAPLGSSLPIGPAPRLLDSLLAGVHTDAHVLIEAVRECQDRARAVPQPGVLRSGDGLVPELWRRTLVVALRDFWARVAAIVMHARPIVLRGDYAESCRVIGLERAGLREIIARIAVLANRVAGIEPFPIPRPVPEAVPEAVPETVPEPVPGPVPEAVEEPTASPQLPIAEDTREPVTLGLPGAILLVDVLGREWAPVVFLIVSTWIAIAILLIVLST